MNWIIEITTGPKAGTKFPLSEQPTIFGSHPRATLSFPEETRLSEEHFSLQVIPTGVRLTDLGSRNGTFHNGQTVSRATIRTGDFVRAGSLEFRIAEEAVVSIPPTQSARTAATPPASLEMSSMILNHFASLITPFYCLLDAACDPAIPQLLAAAEEQIQSLYDGQSATTLAEWAPYLVSLPPNSPLLRILLEKGWGKGWVSYFTSSAPFEELRHHFRKFLMVQTDGGEEVYFRFYDPRVLRDFLPTTPPSDLKAFFGPVEAWLVESEDSESILYLAQIGNDLALTAMPLIPQ